MYAVPRPTEVEDRDANMHGSNKGQLEPILSARYWRRQGEWVCNIVILHLARFPRELHNLLNVAHLIYAEVDCVQMYSWYAASYYKPLLSLSSLLKIPLLHSKPICHDDLLPSMVYNPFRPFHAASADPRLQSYVSLLYVIIITTESLRHLWTRAVQMQISLRYPF